MEWNLLSTGGLRRGCSNLLIEVRFGDVVFGILPHMVCMRLEDMDGLACAWMDVSRAASQPDRSDESEQRMQSRNSD